MAKMTKLPDQPIEVLLADFHESIAKMERLAERLSSMSLDELIEQFRAQPDGTPEEHISRTCDRMVEVAKQIERLHQHMGRRLR